MKRVGRLVRQHVCQHWYRRYMECDAYYAGYVCMKCGRRIVKERRKEWKNWNLYLKWKLEWIRTSWL